MTKALLVGVGFLAGCVTPPRSPSSDLTLLGPPELVEPGVVSTAAATEVRIAFSPDGQRMLWGVIGFASGPGGWEIVESRRTIGGWTVPAAVSFDSPANEFDPSFAPDGSGVYFFSNRPGGLGGDDIYFAPLDAATGRWGRATGLGPDVNSPGDEWAPVLSPDGETLVFATDGRGGAGLHDLFACRREPGGRFGPPENLAALNGPDEDFDAAFLHAGDALVFSRGRFDAGPVSLHWAPRTASGWGAPRRLGREVNGDEPGSLTNGPSIAPSQPGWLYFSSHRPGGAGRMDVWRVPYRR